MNAYLDLIERLNSQHQHGIFDTPLPHAGYGEAAVAIETLVTRIKALEAGLRPFSDAPVSVVGLKDFHLVRFETTAWNVRNARELMDART